MLIFDDVLKRPENAETKRKGKTREKERKEKTGSLKTGS